MRDSVNEVHSHGIDLAIIGIGLRDAYPDWDLQRHTQALQEYMRFLPLCRFEPTVDIAAPGDIGIIWQIHQGISQHYLRHCESYFGQLLLCEKYDMPGSEACCEETRRLYQQCFGDAPMLWYERAYYYRPAQV